MRRRLAAVLAADIAGYSRLMGTDQDGTLRALFAFKKDVLRPLTDRHFGAIVKDMGDGWLVVFQSALDATNCALGIQEALTANSLLHLRIGISLGDVIQEDHDVFGDGVNVAARLQTVAPTGGIALSHSVFETLDAKTAQCFRNAGVHHLRNLVRPVQVWLSHAATHGIMADGRGGDHDSRLVSMVLLPPTRYGQDDKAHNLAIDFSNELLECLQSSDLVSPRVAGAPEGGDYIVTFSPRQRREGSRMQVKLANPSHETVWTGTFDQEGSDNFSWQERVRTEAAAPLFGAMIDSETTRLFDDAGPESVDDEILQAAIEFSEFSAPAMAASVQRVAHVLERNHVAPERSRDALRYLLSAGISGIPVPDGAYQFALETGRTSGTDFVLISLCEAMISFVEEPAGGPLETAVESALQQAPLDPDILVFSGWASVWLGSTRRALRCFNDFERLGGFHSLGKLGRLGSSFALLQAGRIEEALKRVHSVLAATSELAAPHLLRVAALSERQDLPNARVAMEHVKRLSNGGFSVDRVLSPFRASAAGIRLCESLERAGLQSRQDA